MTAPREASDERLDRPAAPHPALNAMLICDQAIQEETSAKTSLVGVFESVRAYQFPARHGFLCVYAKLTDAQGVYQLRLELVRLEDLRAVGQGQFRATFGDRMAPAEVVFQLGDLVFEAPGRYEFRLYANERWVGSKVLNVAKAPETGGPRVDQIRVFGSTVTVRWISFMLPESKPAADAG